jgi:hypothetical protein
MDASNMQIGAKRAAIRKVIQPLDHSSLCDADTCSLQLDHELGIPIGSIDAEDFQLITRIHYIAGAQPSHPSRYPAPI